MKKQNENVKGLSEAAKKSRKQKNLVTMKFNFINYLLETLSVGLLFISRHPGIYFIYFVVNSCGTPLVYYLGIEENRRQAQDYFRTISLSSSVQLYVNALYLRSHIRVAKRSRVSPAPIVTPPAAATFEPSPSQPSSCTQQSQGLQIQVVPPPSASSPPASPLVASSGQSVSQVLPGQMDTAEMSVLVDVHI